MATAAAMIDGACPFHASALRPDEILVVPLAKSAVLQRSGEGATLFLAGKEISFETPAQAAFAAGLVRHSRFRAADAADWSGLDWSEVGEMLEALLAEKVIARAALYDGKLALDREDRPSPLPDAPSAQPRTWQEDGLMAELTGSALDIGYLETVVPIFRIAHTYLDSEGRQVGEANVFPKALRVAVPTQWRTCTYTGTRYQTSKPVNVTALKAMRTHWREMMAVLAAIRTAYLARFPEAEGHWTAGHVERLSASVLALPTYLLLRRDALANGQLHPVLSNAFRVTDGVRMATHQMMMVPGVEAMLSPDTPVTGADILAYAERNYSFFSDHGVCAGPQNLIEEFLAVLIDGAEPKSGWPESLSPEVEQALAHVDAAVEYALLGLRSHAAIFSLWPAMARAYAEIAEAVETRPATAEIRERFLAHRSRMESHSYLGTEAWRQHREAVYADMFGADCRIDRGSEPPCPPAAVEGLRAVMASVAGSAAEPMAAAIGRFLTRGRRLVAAAEASQAEINRLLGRPAPRRRLTLQDANLHNRLLKDQARSLPFLPDELETIFGTVIHVDANDISVAVPSPNSAGTRRAENLRD